MPVPRQELVERNGRVVVDAAEHIGEPGFGIYAAELGGGDQGIGRRRPLATAIGAAEGPLATAEGDAAQSSSGALLVRRILPSLRKRVKAGQRSSM